MKNTMHSCMQTLSNDGDKLVNDIKCWDKLAEKLLEARQEKKFIALLNSIANGNLQCTNLSWKCALDMGVLVNCTSMTNMHYNKDCVEFFSLFFLMFGGSAVNVLRGTGHFGSVVEHETSPGNYDPIRGNFNFAIPSLNTLRKISTDYPNTIDIGFIPHSLDMAQEQAINGSQFVIGFDGKMVVQGCKNDHDGDVNLWGREKPSLQSAVRNLCIRTFCSQDICRPLSEEGIQHKLLKLCQLCLHISRTLRQLRTRITHFFRQKKKLVSLVHKNPDNISKYNTRMSFLHQNSAECEMVLKMGMEAQEYLLKSMVCLQGSKALDSHIVLSEATNCFQLLPPEDVVEFVNLQQTENAKYIKQRTIEWDVLRSTTHVTGSTLNVAIGLDTLKRQKQHHYEFVCGHG